MRRKTGGRSKGTPNKVTAQVREAIAAFAEANVEKLQTWLDAAAENDPARAADLFVRVLEYHVPKLASTESTLDGNLGTREVIVHQIRFGKPGGADGGSTFACRHRFILGKNALRCSRSGWQDRDSRAPIACRSRRAYPLDTRSRTQLSRSQ